MKIFLRSTKDEITTEKEVVSLNEAVYQKKDHEKIHVCYHDEKNNKPCKLI